MMGCASLFNFTLLMIKAFFSLVILFICSFAGVNAQTCTTLGQNPETAFPVCGAQPFPQSEVPPCGGRIINAPGCTGVDLRDLNPFWYKFTCFTSGTLGFRITPNNLGDDYDWQLFDVTGRNPSEVYTNNSLFVACNWSGESGITGASSAGTSLVVCATTTGSPYRPLFSSMPTLIAGHEYILLVSHFTGDAQSGYVLNFTGGTANIIDPLDPHLTTASATCDAMQIRVKLNKKMKCLTLAADGSDFSINAPGNSIVAATGAGCSSSFDMDSVILTMASPLPPGDYTITMGAGSDANTLLDNCNRPIPSGENIPLRIFPILPTPMDSLTRPGCAPNSLRLVFRKPMQCSSIAPDGSDFVVTGPTPVVITAAAGSCSNGVSSTINVQLAGPIQVGGTYTITLQTGSDGNTLTDECSLQTPAGSFINFAIADTVNANFTYNIAYSCAQNTVQYNHNGANGVNSWLWNFDGNLTSNAQNPLITYTDFRQKNTTLIISNGVCRDTASASLFFDNLLVAAFEGPEFICPNETATFVNQSEGVISSYEWTFGNGVPGFLRNPPPQSYPVPIVTRDETVRLIIRNSFGCADTAIQRIKVVNNCYIAVPSAFTPNNDGLNDFLYPLNAYKANNLTFSVYNRFGQRLFFTRNWLDKWDGSFKGQGCDPGTYVWVLQYIHADTNQKVEQKGTVILIR